MADAATYLKSYQAESAHTDRPEFFLTSALIADQLGEKQQAEQFALKALDLLRSGNQLSESDSVSLAAYFLRENHFQKAGEVVQLGLEQSPASRDLLGMMAKIQFQLGQPENAITAAYATQAADQYQQGIAATETLNNTSENPSLFAADVPAVSQDDIRALLIGSLEAVGAWGAAFDERSAILASQENPSVADLRALANCAAGAQKSDKVIEISEKILSMDPDDQTAHGQLADAAAALQDYQTAIEHYNQAIQLAPEENRFWKALVKAQTQAGQGTEAFDTLRAASQALPDDGDIQLSLGEAYLSQAAPTLALPCLRRAAELVESPATTEQVAIRLGQTLFQLGRLSEARAVLEPLYGSAAGLISGSAQSPAEGDLTRQTDPELAYIYARTLLGLQEAAKAIPILTNVVRERPADPQPCLDLAKALMQLGDQASGAKKAIPFLQRLLGIAPDGSESGYTGEVDAQPGVRAEARAILAEAYTALGDWDKAMEAYRKALEEPANRETNKQTRLSLGLGLVALKLEQPEMAVAALQEAAQSEPLNDRIQRSLSDAYLTNGLANDAFQAAKTALDLAPSDINTLTWFIEQGQKIAEQPGFARQTVQSEMVRALKLALQQAPERADLLIRLGSLLFQMGERSDALDIFRKLADTDTATQRISLNELYQAAMTVQGIGDARLTVALLRKAISQAESAPSLYDPAKDGISLADLYQALMRAFEQLDDPESALQALEHALQLDKTRAEFHAHKADLLYKLGKFEAARDDLQEALCQWPENASLHQRMGRTLKALGDLPAALLHAEQGIANLDEEQGVALHQELYLLAAGLAYATLHPRRAFAYLQSAMLDTDPAYHRFENVIMRAEMALDAGEKEAAAEAVAEAEKQAPELPRVQAAAGRRAIREGKCDEGCSKCRKALKQYIKYLESLGGVTPATTKEQFLAELLAMGQAAIESRDWKEALSVFRQAVEMFPEEPLAHFKLAQTIVLCAEDQALCQDLEIEKHAPGADCLLDPACQAFEANLQAAAAQAGSAEILQEGGVLEKWDVEMKRSVGLCARRGHAIFKACLENAQALEYLLQTLIPEAEDIAALVMAYRRCGKKKEALKAVEVGWRPVFEGTDCRKDPLVITQTVLAEDDPQQALEMINQAWTDSNWMAWVWPEPAMVQFLLAKTAFQAGVYPTALQAVQQALTTWPDEAGWQAFAAHIHLKQKTSNRLQELAAATEHLAQATSLEPEKGKYHLALGQIYLESGQVQNAIQSLEQASRLEPENTDGWLALAKAQYLAGNLDQAALSAEHAIEQSEEPIEALLLRAEIALQTSNHRGALSRAQSVLRSKPENPQALYLLARALDGLNRPAEALAVLEKALPLYENPLPMQLERLRLIKRSQSLEAGLRALQELVTQNPKQAAYLALLAEWLSEAGKQEAAVQAARLALQEGLEGLTSKERADLHTLIGLYMRKNGQLDQAIHHLSEAISEASDHLDAYLELGRVYQERREYQQALKVYQKAINLAGGDYRPYYQAGLVLKDSKDYMAAEAMLRRAAQLAPNEVSVHRLLGAVVALNLVHNHRLTASEAHGD
jgi:tetratricopeptide (TPR) repeat protein